MILNYPILSHRRSNAVSLETYPLYSECFLVVFCSSASFFDETHSQNPTNFYQALQLMLFCYSMLEVISSKLTRVWNFFCERWHSTVKVMSNLNYYNNGTSTGTYVSPWKRPNLLSHAATSSCINYVFGINISATCTFNPLLSRLRLRIQLRAGNNKIENGKVQT